MERSNDFLGTEHVGRLMGRYAVPCVISLLVGALYNIVDQIFIANADYLGSYGNAANTVVFPLTVVALAIAVMVGDGCCAFVSMALGRSDLDRARRSVGNIVLSAFSVVSPHRSISSVSLRLKSRKQMWIFCGACLEYLTSFSYTMIFATKVRSSSGVSSVMSVNFLALAMKLLASPCPSACIVVEKMVS